MEKPRKPYKSYIQQRETKFRKIVEMFLKACRNGEELDSKTLQKTAEMTPQQWGNFFVYLKKRLKKFGVEVQSRREITAHYSIDGDPTKLELVLMSKQEKEELLEWALKEKRKQEKD